MAPGLGAALLPKITCPLCWPAYVGLLTSFGLGFLLSEKYLFAVTASALAVSVAALAYRWRERRGLRPMLLGLAGAAAILLGKFYIDFLPLVYAGLAALLAASVWNIWPRKAAPETLVQLEVKGS
jgi:hypothetical protein